MFKTIGPTGNTARPGLFATLASLRHRGRRGRSPSLRIFVSRPTSSRTRETEKIAEDRPDVRRRLSRRAYDINVGNTVGAHAVAAQSAGGGRRAAAGGGPPSRVFISVYRPMLGLADTATLTHLDCSNASFNRTRHLNAPPS
ncbi:hypothetical protein EVAR_21916_1 [Eumeta japonica]|uniref:Uncharacterized protein n=1 Tax=Eumeta variegata TaxID=151549 RepID=A0A4C1XJ64_EUMVA|nr:hypothetical protein EVAR_21916_1 [Eumeta japonica]